MAATRDYSTVAGTQRAILEECVMQGIGHPTQIAYVLATVQHETNNTFQPVEEAYWMPASFRRRLRYAPYWGRGFVQLTWRANYVRYSRILGMDLVKHPERVCEPPIANFILVHGFRTGAFTGKRLSEYVSPTHTDYVSARRCINGLDKAQLIAGYAKTWERRLAAVTA